MISLWSRYDRVGFSHVAYKFIALGRIKHERLVLPPDKRSASLTPPSRISWTTMRLYYCCVNANQIFSHVTHYISAVFQVPSPSCGIIDINNTTSPHSVQLYVAAMCCIHEFRSSSVSVAFVSVWLWNNWTITLWISLRSGVNCK